jgi:hypothetical protein
MMTSNEEKVTKIKNQIQENREKIDELYKSIRVLEREAAFLEYGVAPDIIVVDGKGNRFLVRHLKFIGPRPWVIGSPFKKDGTPAKTERNLYSQWELEQCQS